MLNPEPEQLVELELLHVSVEEFPCVIVDGEAESDADGVGGGLTFTRALALADEEPLVQVTR